ncbi:MAG: DUF4157 domain-containing protein [Nitrosomonas sp.]|nr:DUF4157 domain-containing protein [Nitrosomonas sp.]
MAGGECTECAKKKTALQRKLTIGASNDPLESEADRIADQVVAKKAAPLPVSSLASGQLQRQEMPKEKTNEEKFQEGLEKLGEAFLETPVGKQLLEKIKQDKLIKGSTELGKEFISTWPGKIVTGAAATGAVAALAATHKELPAQIPEIPLDSLIPGLSVKLTYKGPVDKPTEAMITLKFTEQAPKGDADKKTISESDKNRAEADRMAADQDKFQAGLRYPPGSQEDLQQKAQQEAIRKVVQKYSGGPNIEAAIKKYPWLTTPQQPKNDLQLTMPKPSFGVQPPSLLGDEFKLKSPDEQKKKLDELPLQRKLSIGASNDPLEQEADRVADQVMAAPRHSVVNATAPHIQRFTGHASEGANAAPDSVDRVLANSGRPFEPALRQDMELRFGYDFSQVRVHTGSAAEQSAREVNANAYTVGHNIVFGVGQFAPETQNGQRLIAHELTHVVQQSGSDRITVGQNHAKHDLSPIADLGRSTINYTTPHLRHGVSPTQISRVTKSGTDETSAKSATPPESSLSTGTSASPSPSRQQGSLPQRLRFDILGADTALADHLAKAAGSSRNPDLRVNSLEDMIGQLESKAPTNSGRCVEQISIFNHGNPSFQVITGAGSKKSVTSAGRLSKLPSSGFSLEWLYSPANQSTLVRLRNVFCCDAKMHWLGCSTAGVWAEGGERSEAELKEKEKSFSEKYGEENFKERFIETDKPYRHFYQNEEDAVKHGANLQGAKFGPVNVQSWADATCTSIRAADDFMVERDIDDPSRWRSEVIFGGNFRYFNPSTAGKCSCDPASGHVRGEWDAVQGIDYGDAKWQVDLQKFNRAVMPDKGTPDPRLIDHSIRSLLKNIASSLAIPPGLPKGTEVDPWINHDPNNDYGKKISATVVPHMVLCHPSNCWKWIVVNPDIIQQTPAYTKEIIEHELQHALDLYIAAFEYKLVNGPAPSASSQACDPFSGWGTGKNAVTDSGTPFGKYALEFKRDYYGQLSKSRHVEIYADSVAPHFQRLTPIEKVTWFSAMIANVPADIPPTEPLASEPLVTSVFQNPVGSEQTMRHQFTSVLFDVTSKLIYRSAQNQRNSNLGKAETLLNHFTAVWSTDKTLRPLLFDSLREEKKRNKS